MNERRRIENVESAHMVQPEKLPSAMDILKAYGVKPTMPSSQSS